MGKYDAQNKWQQNNTTHVSLKLFHGKDAAIIEWLEKQPSKQAAIKQLINEHLSRSHSEG